MERTKSNICEELQKTIYDLITDLEQVFTLDNEKNDFVAVGFFYRRLAQRLL